MAPRTHARPAREFDFSNVGKIGRRTGVTLPQGRVDENGMEEITGIFSSPRKSSPLKQSVSIMESVEKTPGITPVRALSARKSLPARSASPRKSGISGTARRSKAVDVFRERDEEESAPAATSPKRTSPRILTPTIASSSARRFSPSKTPLRDNLLSRPQTARSTRQPQGEREIAQLSEDANVPSSARSVRQAGNHAPNGSIHAEDTESVAIEIAETEEDYALPAMGDDDEQLPNLAPHVDDLPESEHIPVQYDDEDADETFEPEKRVQSRSREPTKANSRRKRKSDAVEQDGEIDNVSSPAAKRAKRISDEGAGKSRTKVVPTVELVESPSPKAAAASKSQDKGKARAPMKNKDVNTKMSARQQNELNDVVEKIRARPGPKKSLYVLRRETPADEGVTHTRSGRISIKPLAFWRNEQCVYGGSPGSASLADGARFPFHSIKEIIRRDEVDNTQSKKSKRGRKPGRKGKQKAKSRSESPRSDVETESDPDDSERMDPDAEPWETDIGAIRGSVSIWDVEQQSPVEEQEEIDIAYAAAAIETRGVKGSTFKYAKLLSSKFMGSGIVELPSGGVKRPKNSRKMHMSFFVATGRVTVQVGPINGPESKFSIGKGGFWQVPRGNQYSIQNDHQKTARLFFSQACETVSLDMEE